MTERIIGRIAFGPPRALGPPLILTPSPAGPVRRRRAKPFRLRPESRPERELIRACRDYLARCRILSWRENVVGVPVADRYIHPVPKGQPDISAVIPPGGRALFVECKSPGTWPSLVQARRHGELRQAGALVLVVHSWQELAAELRAAGVAAP